MFSQPEFLIAAFSIFLVLLYWIIMKFADDFFWDKKIIKQFFTAVFIGVVTVAIIIYIERHVKAKYGVDLLSNVKAMETSSPAVFFAVDSVLRLIRLPKKYPLALTRRKFLSTFAKKSLMAGFQKFPLLLRKSIDIRF